MCAHLGQQSKQTIRLLHESDAIHAKIFPRVYLFSENKYLIICLPRPYLSQRFIFRESMNPQFLRISGVIHTLMCTQQCDMLTNDVMLACKASLSFKDGDSVQSANSNVLAAKVQQK